jgi:hypothetical protein
MLFVKIRTTLLAHGVPRYLLYLPHLEGPVHGVFWLGDQFQLLQGFDSPCFNNGRKKLSNFSGVKGKSWASSRLSFLKIDCIELSDKYDVKPDGNWI